MKEAFSRFLAKNKSKKIKNIMKEAKEGMGKLDLTDVSDDDLRAVIRKAMEDLAKKKEK